MGKRANQFMAAICASAQLPGLKDAEPRSIIAAAMVAATLDLPVNPTLGQAHIVAYGDGQGNKVAQFQIGYKGLIQLALRSGQYRRLNSGPVSAEVFTGYDTVGEPILDFRKNDPIAEAAGYYCAFETLNGFIKVVYWSRAQAEAHAKRFSKAYAKGYSTPWKSDFDSMATKTVIKAALGKWGLLSIEMQKAVVHDQGAQTDVDADVKYVDGGEDKTVDEQMPGDPRPARPAPPPRAKKGVAAVEVTAGAPSQASAQASSPEVVTEVETVPAKAEPVAAPAPAASEPAPAKPRAFLNDKEEIAAVCRVLEVNTTTIKTPEDIMHTVKAKVEGDFMGEVYHLGGATLVTPATETAAAVLSANKPWVVGNTLALTLLGRKRKDGVAVVVTKVEEQEGF